MRSAGGTIVERLQLEVWRWAADARSYAGVVVCYIAGLVYAYRIATPQARASRAAAIVAVTMLVFNTLVMSKESGYYSLYPAAFTLLAATYLADRMHVPPPHRTVAMALLVGAVVSSLPMLVVPRAAAVFVQREARSYAAIETGLRKLIPPGARVWSVPEAWYALAHDGRSVRTPSLGYNPAPDAFIDHYAVLRRNRESIPDGFMEIGRVGQELPT